MTRGIHVGLIVFSCCTHSDADFQLNAFLFSLCKGKNKNALVIERGRINNFIKETLLQKRLNEYYGSTHYSHFNAMACISIQMD